MTKRSSWVKVSRYFPPRFLAFRAALRAFLVLDNAASSSRSLAAFASAAACRSGEFRLSRGFLRSALGGFLGCLLGRFPHSAGLLDGPALRDAGLPCENDGAPHLLPLGVLGVSELGAMMLKLLFFGVGSGSLAIGETRVLQPSDLRCAQFD